MSKAVYLITGISAAGKSTVAQELATSLPAAVHLRGDTFRRMVVTGRHEMSAEPTPEAIAQLRLRYRLAAACADGYFDAGFDVVFQDVILGEYLPEVIGLLRSRPLIVVVLAPDPAVVAERERGRAKSAYVGYTPQMLDDELRRNTPKVGLWLDSSRQTPAETAAEILARGWTEGQVR
ncbi:AAA family ATPase [Amycolatopsis albispora]|uniref:Phosphotransferase n=1 Tax=Amycolatopsis albispora TaxID=1804986 RepID=A0A344LI23_9PSEU|nr:AAA family ATPase [Amycolatopsis albispora]AXB47697.1 phosphotransferase [Amycolatopsis albispora]